MSYTRFAIYYVPSEGSLADFGSAWLGWDVVTGRAVSQFALAGLDDATKAPRKYGFHGTLKPPFKLAAGCRAEDLADAIEELASTCTPARCEGLTLARLGRFLALVPVGDTADLSRVAATCVRVPDRFRAPPDEAELTRRRARGLSPQQEALLAQWGYPYVMEAFRFHLTLTSRLPQRQVGGWMDHATAHLPALPTPFVLDDIALVGERPDGFFEVIRRYPLRGGHSKPTQSTAAL